MQCLQCGAEMRLVLATHDDTMMVPGYEDQTFECTGCREREQRRTFKSASAAPAAEAAEQVPVELAASEAAVVQLGSMEVVPGEAVEAAIVPDEAVQAESMPLEAASVRSRCWPHRFHPRAARRLTRITNCSAAPLPWCEARARARGRCEASPTA